MKSAFELSTLSEVASYWKECLSLLSSRTPDSEIASMIVSVVNNPNDSEWSDGVNSHPAYSLIFEIAASLELPPEMTDKRVERWSCIKALVRVLESECSGSNDSAISGVSS